VQVRVDVSVYYSDLRLKRRTNLLFFTFEIHSMDLVLSSEVGSVSATTSFAILNDIRNQNSLQSSAPPPPGKNSANISTTDVRWSTVVVVPQTYEESLLYLAGKQRNDRIRERRRNKNI